jgi:hypothetical protein
VGEHEPEHRPRRLTPGRRPTPVARLGVGVAARLLPTPADRRRYQAEFVGELYGLSIPAQLRHAAGVLSQALALRSARGGSSPRYEEVAVYTTTAGQRFCCRYLRWHHWSPFSTPDGGRYVACTVCRREHGGWDCVSGGFMGGAGGGGG